MRRLRIYTFTCNFYYLYEYHRALLINIATISYLEREAMNIIFTIN